MSVHLIGCVKAMRGLGRSHKLALIAFADSADERTHIAFPGYIGVQEWAEVSRSRAAELIRDLVDAGWLQKVRDSGPGRRAEYVVFPDGCCELHRPTPETGVIDSVDEALAVLRAAGYDTATLADNTSDASDVNGSEFPDPLSGNRSDASDVLDTEPVNGSEISDLNGVHVQNRSDASDPFTTTTTNPPTPQPDRRCRRHLDQLGDSCRSCGTTPRQLAAAAEAEAARARHRDRQARIRQAAADAEAARRDSTDPDIRNLLDTTRATIGAGT